MKIFPVLLASASIVFVSAVPAAEKCDKLTLAGNAYADAVENAPDPCKYCLCKYDDCMDYDNKDCYHFPRNSSEFKKCNDRCRAYVCESHIFCKKLCGYTNC